MSSPSNAYQDPNEEENYENQQVTFRFCSECSNMLYPKEDKDARELHFTCRTCHYTEKAKSNCVFRHNLDQSVGETAGVTQDVSTDPTLPRSNRQCPKCSHDEAVFFQSQQRGADTGMSLFYVCCACGHIY